VQTNFRRILNLGADLLRNNFKMYSKKSKVLFLVEIATNYVLNSSK